MKDYLQIEKKIYIYIFIFIERKEREYFKKKEIIDYFKSSNFKNFLVISVFWFK